MSNQAAIAQAWRHLHLEALDLPAPDGDSEIEIRFEEIEARIHALLDGVGAPARYLRDLTPTIAAIRREFPGWGWSACQRDTPRGKMTGEGYIHNNRPFEKGCGRVHFDHFAMTPEIGLCAALCAAQAWRLDPMEDVL